jgi:hypothetical protein
MSEPRLGNRSIVAGNACTALTQRLQLALHSWFDSRTTQRGLNVRNDRAPARAARREPNSCRCWALRSLAGLRIAV